MQRSIVRPIAAATLCLGAAALYDLAAFGAPAATPEPADRPLCFTLAGVISGAPASHIMPLDGLQLTTPSLEGASALLSGNIGPADVTGI